MIKLLSTKPPTLRLVNPSAAKIKIFFFFFNDPATPDIYTLSLHDALPISRPASFVRSAAAIVPLRVAAFPVPNVAGNSVGYYVAGSPSPPGVWPARPVSSGRPLHPFRAAPPELLCAQFHTDSFPCPIPD